MTDKEEIMIDGIDVSGCEHHRKCILPDNIGCKIDDFLCCDKPNCNYKQLVRKTQECEKLSILAQEESARNGYVEYELNDKLKQKTQECENLKAEEKYLKQCCTKAGEELAKHSFEYDGKEKNLVVQAMELNEKYEKLKKAFEEIEEYTKNFSEVDLFQDIKDIINKAKGEGNE